MIFTLFKIEIMYMIFDYSKNTHNIETAGPMPVRTFFSLLVDLLLNNLFWISIDIFSTDVLIASINQASFFITIAMSQYFR